MKKPFFFLFLLIISQMLSAQSGSEWNNKNNKGQKIGKWKATHSNGKTRYVGQFEKDVPTGTFTYYYPNGKQKTTLTYKDKSTAYAKHFYKNGELLSEGKFINQKKDSIWVSYADNNTVIEKIRYFNGEKNGLCLTYFPNGQLARSLEYSNGLENGKFVEYFSTSEKMEEKQFEMGKLNGLQIRYLANGKKVSKGEYINDVKEGRWLYYGKNGGIETVVFYKNGVVVKTEGKPIEKTTKEVDMYRGNVKDVLEVEDLKSRIKYD